MLAKTWSNWNSQTLLPRMQNGTATGKTLWQFAKKLNINLPYDPKITLLNIYPREMKTYIPMKTYIQMFIAALCIITPKEKNNLNVLQLVNGYTVVNPYNELG